MSVASKTVLIVCDAEGTYDGIAMALGDSGFDIKPVRGEAECIASIEAELPVLVFIALFCPLIDPLSIVQRIRSTEADLPLVLLADESSSQQLVPLLQGGATDYLILPIADTALISYVVKRNIERRREIRRRKRTERDLKKVNKTLVDSLKVLERDQQAGFRVQQGMMPDSPFSAGGLTLQHRIVPSLILSGDFIDYFELPDRRMLLYIADVSGHGASGAIVTVLLKSLFSRLYGELDELGLRDAGEILEWLNRELLACNVEQHVTVFLGIVEAATDRLEYASAGQFPATILRSADATRYLEMGGLPLGIYSSARYACREVVLPKAFNLVMFSDGVFEILSQETLKAKEEYLLSLVKCHDGDIDRISDRLGLSEVREVPDDIAVFTVARAG
jgi:phosphoserine phosphatase RsbU/P